MKKENFKPISLQKNDAKKKNPKLNVCKLRPARQKKR